MLGDLYLYGNEIPVNYKEFFKWKMKAVENGRKSAKFDLSLAYINGWGVPKSVIKAYMWMSLYKITDQQPIVKLNMDQLESQLSSKELAIAQDMAAKCQARDFKNCD
jgi:TPR repeat protein